MMFPDVIVAPSGHGGVPFRFFEQPVQLPRQLFRVRLDNPQLASGDRAVGIDAQ